jgi:hypothetical protein
LGIQTKNGPVIAYQISNEKFSTYVEADAAAITGLQKLFGPDFQITPINPEQFSVLQAISQRLQVPFDEQQKIEAQTWPEFEQGQPSKLTIRQDHSGELEISLIYYNVWGKLIGHFHKKFKAQSFRPIFCFDKKKDHQYCMDMTSLLYGELDRVNFYGWNAPDYWVSFLPRIEKKLKTVSLLLWDPQVRAVNILHFTSQQNEDSP